MRFNQASFADAVIAADPGARPEFLNAELGDRFRVYRNNYFHGLSLILKDAYPRCCRVVGEMFFMAMAREFVARFPPRTRSLVLFGEEFPNYLTTFEPARSVRYLPDLARLERAALEALHERDARPFGPRELEAMGEALLTHRFRPHPATRLVSSDYPIVQLWHANGESGSTGPKTIKARAETALITRPQYTTQVHCLLGADAVFVEQLLKGATVEDAFASSLRVETAFNGQEAWQILLASGALAAVDTA